MGPQTVFKIPRHTAFDWPPRGSIESMGAWTFKKGIATFDTRTSMQGRQVESPQLAPESRPPRKDSCGLSPSTKRNVTPLSYYSESLSASTLPDEATLYCGSGSFSRKETHPPSKCFHCGLPWVHTRQLSPTGDSSHWFVDIHDGVNRKMAYLFCWKCVELVQRQMRPRHIGCGHYFSPPFLSTADKLNREDLMLCVRCRESLRDGLRG
ncbi:hypothetical protein FJTKL_13890 [Diaporthe vaccinii]|uniref:Uncharacterized protein n=1 Tax=Diaporthe vaccinii TaxID=105482 RepID=A0ABR4F973_9PEZI